MWPGAEHFTSAIDLLSDLRERYPEATDYQFLLALCLRDSSPPAPTPESDQAIQLLQQLAGKYPAIPDYVVELYQTYVRLDPRWLQPDDLPAAEARLRSAAAGIEKLVAEHPHVPEYAALSAQVAHRLGTLLTVASKSATTEQKDQQSKEAKTLFAHALEVQTRLTERYPQSGMYRMMLGWIAGSLVEVLIERHELPEALQALESTIETIEEFPTDKPGQPPHRAFSLGMFYRQLGRVLELQGDESGAAKAREQASQFGPAWPPEPKRDDAPRETNASAGG
jgi:tetratricopeptide (TPR) repeat protein